ncbi:hypothetical protein NHP21005_17480 [Helicobacter sp. NHP21005]|uniref:AAA family ATPase n=1 Tax=Helicobacter felistomachi TaxID=3040201 RepID=UPI0025729E35|nr:AAA family ATPase [Helicobacter sp. NHP21005]BEG58060.1 hypothetical protein NHP21005_17480 [Helicobacter sp. NHP21005]
MFGNSGDLHIPFEAFKWDLLEAFKGNDWELQRAFCKLQPYLVGEILLFEITKDTNTPQRFLSKDSVENICKTLKQQEMQERNNLTHLVHILCQTPLKSPLLQPKTRLMRLYLEKGCGVLELNASFALDRALQRTEIAFTSVPINIDGTHRYYFPLVFRLWALERLQELFKREHKGTLAALLSRLRPPHFSMLCRFGRFERERWHSCFYAMLEHLQLPLHIARIEGAWQADRVLGFPPFALLLNDKPTLSRDINFFLQGGRHNTLPLLQRSERFETKTPREERLKHTSEGDRMTAMVHGGAIDMDCQEEVPDTQPLLYTPETLMGFLNEVSGQEKAKHALCIAISEHHARSLGQSSLEKTNLLLIGPSGSGKTFMTTTLLKNLDIPHYIADASSLTPTGWRGEEVQSIFIGLYINADKDIEKAQKGVIFLDEVDKLGLEVTDQQFKSLVQTELLKLMEGHTITFEHNKQSITMKTDGILFVFAGHFKDLYANNTGKNAEQSQNPIGFTQNPAPTMPYNKALEEVNSKDLQRCGLFREFVGRIGLRVVLEPINPKCSPMPS